MARYRKVRTDWHTHPKTAGMSPLARDLQLQAHEANIAGVLERSVRRMAALAGGGTTTKDVEDALAELVQRKVAMWWPDLEILWIVEAADEQCDNEKAWKAAEEIFRNTPSEVRLAASRRYENRVSPPKSGGGIPSDGGVGIPSSDADRAVEEEQEQEQEQGKKPEQEKERAGARGRADLPPPPPLSLSGPDAVLREIDAVRRDFADRELVDDPVARARLRVPTSGDKTRDGVGRALAQCREIEPEGGGLPLLLDVYRHACSRAAAGFLEPVLLACMFHGDGFGAHLKRLLDDREHARKRRPPVQAPEPTGPPVSFEEAAAVTERFRLGAS